VKLLLVKMSSLGDVVHTLPAVSDAVAHVPELELDWVVEEAYLPIVAAHPGVAKPIPIAWRRWRSALGTHRPELRRFWRELRTRRYDLVLDAQGLVKSAVVAAFARGSRSAGFDHRSAREPIASVAYRRPIAVPREQHAVDRLRALFGQALGYPAPRGAPRFGLERSKSAGTGPVVFLHGTTWRDKVWPEPFWRELAASAGAAGLRLLIPWGSLEERARAERIAEGGAGAGCEVAPALDLAELMRLLADARAVVSVDSGLGHLAAALGTPVVGLFGPTDVRLTGLRGAIVSNLAADFPCAPCLARECAYRGAPVSRGTFEVWPPCFARLPPERVWAELVRVVQTREARVP